MTDNGDTAEIATDLETAKGRESMTAGARELKQAYEQGRQDFHRGVSVRTNPFAPTEMPRFLDLPPDRRQLLKARLWLKGFQKELYAAAENAENVGYCTDV